MPAEKISLDEKVPCTKRLALDEKGFDMICNNNFNAALQHSGLSMYALSKRSGIPYTTINELHNGKNDINQCAVSTVWRLGAVIGVPPESLMNPIYYLNGVKGRYKGIDYTWVTSDESCIVFEYDGEKVTLSTGAVYNIPSRIEYYNIIAGWMIKDYIWRKDWERDAQRLVGRKRDVR